MWFSQTCNLCWWWITINVYPLWPVTQGCWAAVDARGAEPHWHGPDNGSDATQEAFPPWQHRTVGLSASKQMTFDSRHWTTTSVMVQASSKETSTQQAPDIRISHDVCTHTHTHTQTYHVANNWQTWQVQIWSESNYWGICELSRINQLDLCFNSSLRCLIQSLHTYIQSIKRCVTLNSRLHQLASHTLGFADSLSFVLMLDMSRAASQVAHIMYAHVWAAVSVCTCVYSSFPWFELLSRVIEHCNPSRNYCM